MWRKAGEGGGKEGGGKEGGGEGGREKGDGSLLCRKFIEENTVPCA